MKACHHFSLHRRPSLKCILKYYIQKPLKYVVSMTIVTTGFFIIIYLTIEKVIYSFQWWGLLLWMGMTIAIYLYKVHLLYKQWLDLRCEILAMAWRHMHLFNTATSLTSDKLQTNLEFVLCPPHVCWLVVNINRFQSLTSFWNLLLLT